MGGTDRPGAAEAVGDGPGDPFAGAGRERHSGELFAETQPMWQNKILWVVMPAATLAGIVAVAAAGAGGGSTVWLIIALVLGLDLFVLWGLSLRTVVRRDELRVVFRPFVRRRIPIGDIVSASAVRYDPLGECGGWGVKGSKRWGLVLNVSGDRGVSIETEGGKKILIGSRRADELAGAIASARTGGAGTTAG